MTLRMCLITFFFLPPAQGMLVEGPPGPEGPAVSGIFPLLQVWDALLLPSATHVSRESFGVDLLVQK